MPINNIYKYDILNIFKNGKQNNKVLEFVDNDLFYKEEVSLPSCLLVDQINKELKDIPLKEVLVLMDLSSFKDEILKLQNFEDGIVLNIDGKLITFELFIRSNNMLRNYCTFFINKQYKDLILNRISFNFNKDKINISTFNHYLGYLCNECNILDIDLNSDEVAIIEDKHEEECIDTITSISMKYILSLLEKYIKDLENERYSLKIKDELNKYLISKDYDKLSLELKSFIISFLNLFDLDLSLAYKNAKTLKDKYYIYKDKKEVVELLEVKHFNVNINIFNEIGLISSSFCDEINKSLTNKITSFNINLPFINGVVHSCDFITFFKKHNINEIKSICSVNNEGLVYEYKKVDKLKLIISESMFKAFKYLKKLNIKNQVNYYFSYLNKYNYKFSFIINKEYKNLLNYQYISTLPLDDNDINYLINKGKEEIKKVSSLDYIKSYLKDNSLQSDYLMMDKYRDYYLVTSRFKEIREDIIQHAKNNVIIGKIGVDSSMRYVSCDLLDFLYHIINKENKNSLGLYEYFAPNSNNDYGVILKTPLFTRNEIVVGKYKEDEERKYYFGHLNIVMANYLNLYRFGKSNYKDLVLFIDDKFLSKNLFERLKDKYKIINTYTLNEEFISFNYRTNINSLYNCLNNNSGLLSNVVLIKNMNSDSDINDELAYYTILNRLDNESNINGNSIFIDEESKNKNLFIDVKNAINNHLINDDCYITNKKTIKEITKNKDLHYLYKIMNEIIHFDVKMSNVLKKKDYNEMLNINNNFDIRGRIIVKSLVASYNKLVALNKFCSINSKICLTNINVITSFIKDEINMDFNEFIAYFKSENPKNLLLTYLKNHYHFLTNYDDKVNFIKNELGLDLPVDILEIVTDFKDRKYLLLYCCLMYHKEMEVINNNSNIENVSLSKEIEALNINDQKYAYSIRDNMIKSIISNKKMGEYKYENLLNDCKIYIKENYKNLTFNEVGNALNLVKDSIIYDLFSDLILSYYGEGENDEI